MTTTEAWGLLEQAASDRDVDDFRQVSDTDTRLKARSLPDCQ